MPLPYLKLVRKEGSIGEFEARVIAAIANLDNVEWWHRNISRKGFRINGYLNHYPDFIIKTTKTVLFWLKPKVMTAITTTHG